MGLYRVSRLMGEEREAGSRRNAAEIVQLCEGYSIASEYASFIVLENDAEYQRWKIDRRNATRIVRDRRAEQAVRQRLEELRRQTAESIGPRPADKVAGKDAAADQLAQADNLQPQASVPQSAANPAQPADGQLPRQDFGPRFSTGGSNNRGGGSGGGAIDPLTALIAAGLAAAGWASRRKPARV